MKTKNNGETTNRSTSSRRILLTPFIILVVLAGTFLILRLQSGSIPETSSMSQVKDVNTGLYSSNHNEVRLVTILELSAKCMDGSQPGFYFRPGRNSSVDKWHVHFEGGGWCFNDEDCISRSRGHLGSSNSYRATISDSELKHYLSSNPNENRLMHNWNTIVVKYCDASSYAGDREIDIRGHKLYFKGKNNRDYTIKTALNMGMKFASQIVISGCSAGALGVLLGIEQMASIIHEVNKDIHVSAFSDSGYFMDYSGLHVDYSADMKRIFQILNMSAGASPACIRQAEDEREAKAGAKLKPVASFSSSSIPSLKSSALSTERGRKMSAENESDTTSIGQQKYYGKTAVGENFSVGKEKCVFAVNLVPHINVPLFALQPQYDHWQNWRIVGEPSNEPLINYFGSNLTRSLMKNLLTGKPQHGVYIDSCTHHCYGCNAPEENTWNGERIVVYDSGKMINPNNALFIWHERLLAKKTKPNTDDENSFTRNRNIWFQNAPYPCSSCCLCS